MRLLTWLTGARAEDKEDVLDQGQRASPGPTARWTHPAATELTDNPHSQPHLRGLWSPAVWPAFMAADIWGAPLLRYLGGTIAYTLHFYFYLQSILASLSCFLPKDTEEWKRRTLCQKEVRGKG